VSPGLTEQANGTAFLRYFKPVKCFMNSCNNLKDKQAMSFFFFLIFYLVLIHVGDYPQGSHINHKSITLNVSLFAYSYESLLFLGVEYSKIK